jgi:hypothetical protein
MENTIHTLHDFMFRTESITYLLVVAVLIGFPFFWKFLTEREDDGTEPPGEHAAGKHHH